MDKYQVISELEGSQSGDEDQIDQIWGNIPNTLAYPG